MFCTEPHIDGRRLSHLTTESPDFAWLGHYVSDVRFRRLPSLRTTAALAGKDRDA
ncbi:hypothetical protein [Amycolatopsis coloradensis]|uniref:hypothetical protein n=1 Tax=Amycolatopsis coloradensis TaxID=76021 RepID=UPI001300CA7A|nr:hypothetical protein [Amycolatopsis coloradensis]